jgi:hypothetical protein
MAACDFLVSCVAHTWALEAATTTVYVRSLTPASGARPPT